MPPEPTTLHYRTNTFDGCPHLTVFDAVINKKLRARQISRAKFKGSHNFFCPPTVNIFATRPSPPPLPSPPFQNKNKIKTPPRVQTDTGTPTQNTPNKKTYTTLENSSVRVDTSLFLPYYQYHHGNVVSSSPLHPPSRLTYIYITRYRPATPTGRTRRTASIPAVATRERCRTLTASRTVTTW